MKKTFLFILTFIYVETIAQIPNWEWATTSGGNNDDVCLEVSSDNSGNFYITGNFFNYPGPYPFTLGTNTLGSNGATDAYIAKYNISGNLLWVRTIGGANGDYAERVCNDVNGNVYVTGSYSSPSLTIGTSTLINNSINQASDIFIAKYDSSGNVLWARSLGGTINEYYTNISTDVSGNLYVTGSFNSPSLVLGTTTLTNAGSTDIFIVKYDSAGNLIWVKSGGGLWADECNDIVTDNAGNFYLTGYFESPTFTLSANTLTNSSSSLDSDFFIVKYDASGNIIWVKSAIGAAGESGNCISTDSGGNVYISGEFGIGSSMVFGTTTLSSLYVAPTLFLVKYSTSGNLLWARSAVEGPYKQDVYGMSVDLAGNPSILGNFESSFIDVSTTTLNCSGNSDVFLAKFSPSGNLISANQISAPGYEYARSIVTDINGSTMIGGYFAQSSLLFGPSVLNYSGWSHLFIAKFDGYILGLSENLQKESVFNLFPNPTADNLTISFSSPGSSDIHNIRIINSLGQVIREEELEIKNNSFTLRISDLDQGIYQIHFKTNAGTVTKQFVKN